MGLRLIITILGIWLIAAVLRNAYRKHLKAKTDTSTGKPAVDMVQCTYCKTHLPKHEAVIDKNGDFFCSEEHHEKHQQKTN